MSDAPDNRFTWPDLWAVIVGAAWLVVCAWVVWKTGCVGGVI